MSFVISLLMASLASGTTRNDLAAQADKAFTQGAELAGTKPDEARQSFASAAAIYSQLRQSGGVSPALYRNLGNAYLLAAEPDDPKADNLARAILAYRLGLQLDPTDHELRRCLEYARGQVYYPPPGTFGQPAVDHRPPWLPRWPGVLFVLAAATFGVIWFAKVRWWMTRRSLWLNVACGFAAISAITVIAWMIEWQSIKAESERPIVVIARDGVQLLVGNGSRYPARYETTLNRGVEGRVRYQRGSWLQVELGGGQIGWLPRSVVVMDEQ